ncbi:glutamate receptor ionotropic, delta-1-like [Littorina saxatilis]|uniref:glutamate receptor ionotropic, delta-1-like n=1 Tax=Littorina saxatilis TaxID=31220 RepID=UPI0038B60F70
MTSRWLVTSNGHDHLLRHLYVNNVTMDNVAVVQMTSGTLVELCSNIPLKESESGRQFLTVHSLMWRTPGRQWSQVVRVNILKQRKLPSAGQRLQCLTEKRTFPNVLGGFNGRHLRLLAKPWLSYAQYDVVNGSKVWKGLNLDLLHFASNSLNFTYEIMDAEHERWGKGTSQDPDTGYYGRVSRKEVDVGVANTDLLYDRVKVMDFADVIHFSHIVMVYRKPPTPRDIWMLLTPLRMSIISALAGSMVVMTLFVFIMEVTHKQHFASPPTCEVALWSPCGRVLVYSWWLLCMVVAAAYSGTLTAVLSVTKTTDLFLKPRDLLTKDHDYTWGVQRDSGVQLALQVITGDTLQQNVNQSVNAALWAGIQGFAERDPDVNSEDIDTLAAKVRDEDFVLFVVGTNAMTLFAGDCSLLVVQAGMTRTMSSLVLPKGSALTKPLSELILGLHSTGMLTRLSDRWFPPATCPPRPPGPLTIALHHVHGVFLLLLLGAGLACGVMVLELCHRRRTGMRGESN